MFIDSYVKERQAAQETLISGSLLFNTSRGLVEAATLGEGTPVLISHGSGGGYDMGLWLGEVLGGKIKYIAPSRFGYLRSLLPPTPTAENQADAYAALLDLLKIPSVIILGLSAGGISALQFALRHPNRCKGLIMLSAVSRPVPRLSPFLMAMVGLMLRSDFFPWAFYKIAPSIVFQANGISKTLYNHIKSDQKKLKSLDALFRTTLPPSLRREGMLNDMKQSSAISNYPLERISAPTLVIHAVNDPIIPFKMGEYTASAIPKARLVRLSDGGHFTCLTHQEITTPEMQKFFAQYSG